MMGGGVGRFYCWSCWLSWFGQSSRSSPTGRIGWASISGREDSAEETLRQRFARGEIDAEEYDKRHRILREESPAAHR